MLKQISEDYFMAFLNKDINKIRNLLSLDISLRDWEFEATGIEGVISIYEKIFKNVNNIKVDLINLNIRESVVMAELSIAIDDFPALRVVDVLEFSGNGKIMSIRAYKG
jgi:hypothetical protein